MQNRDKQELFFAALCISFIITATWFFFYALDLALYFALGVPCFFFSFVEHQPIITTNHSHSEL